MMSLSTRMSPIVRAELCHRLEVASDVGVKVPLRHPLITEIPLGRRMSVSVRYAEALHFTLQLEEDEEGEVAYDDGMHPEVHL